MTTATIQPAAWRVSMGTTEDHNHWHYCRKKPKAIDDGEIWEPLYSASTLESLQRENEALKKDRDFWKEQFQVETRYRIELADRGTLLALTDANSRAEAAEAEAKMLREALHKIESGYGANDICARIARDALSAQVQDVAGWQIVPIEPTEEMEKAGRKEAADCDDTYGSSIFSAAEIYRAMLAAAPAKQEGGTNE